MPPETDHDLIRDTAGKVEALENTIKGIVPKQCVETSTNLANISKNLESMNNNLKAVWLAMLAMVLTIVGTTYINNNKPAIKQGIAQAISMPQK